jgi:ribosome-binding protein aMBF1 (putative translation factor)
MPRCEVCGNQYDRTFRVRFDDAPEREHVFDSLECAIHRLAPRCAHCGCSVIGHGIDVDSIVYCCTHCAREGEDATDRASKDSFPASDAPARTSSPPFRSRL